MNSLRGIYSLGVTTLPTRPLRVGCGYLFSTTNSSHMKHKPTNAGKAFADGFAKGKAESAEMIRQLKAALDKALAENLAMRPKT